MRRISGSLGRRITRYGGCVGVDVGIYNVEGPLSCGCVEYNKGEPVELRGRECF
jgi:hypothetical protein